LCDDLRDPLHDPAGAVSLGVLKSNRHAKPTACHLVIWRTIAG
jgi:hypothetical protein